MNLTQYVSLREISEQKQINYHTLRRWKIRSRVREERRGTMIFIRRRDVGKILKVGGVK